MPQGAASVERRLTAVAGRRVAGEDGTVPASPRRRLREGDIAAWLIKTSVSPERLVEGWPPDTTQKLERCLRRSYRLDLMRPGHLALLWLSGPHRPGVHAVGTVTGPPTTGRTGADRKDGPDKPRGGDDRPAVSLSLRLLPRPVSRATLLQSPSFADAEVLRMPAGSNPSYLTAAQLAAVRDLLDDAG
jgi:hypothetical protein